MQGDFLKKFATGFAMLGIVLMALSGGSLLGKYYTRVLQGWEINRSRPAGTAAVTAEKNSRTLNMNPVAFYFVQTGVFSDHSAAEAGTADLIAAGYKPYIGQQAPFRVFLGVFGNRESAVEFQARLKEKGIGGFIQTVVLNNREITVNAQSLKTLEDLQMLLGDYTEWLTDNAALWQMVSAADGDRKVFNERADKVIRTFQKLPGHLSGQIADQGFRERLSVLYSSTGNYVEQLKTLQKTGRESDFQLTQRQFNEVIENYSLFVRQLDNISKT